MNSLIIDAQQIPGAEKHLAIFEAFDELSYGQALVIVNNYDPKMLLNHFYEQRVAEFTEEYISEGPAEWKVKLTKIKKEGCCGCCGH